MDSLYSIRPATADDIDLIVEQRKAMFQDMDVDEMGIHAQEKPFRDWLSWQFKAGSYLGWFAVRGEDIAGGAGLWIHEWLPGPLAPEGIRGYICNVYTHPDHRHHGLAHTLVQTCVDEARQRGLIVVALHASEAGRPIYLSMGFGVTAELRLLLKDD